MPWLNISVMFIMKIYRFSLRLIEIDIRDEVRLRHRRFHGCHIWAKVKAVWELRFRLGSKTRRLGSKDPGKPGSGCAACEAVFASTAQTFNATSRFIMC